MTDDKKDLIDQWVRAQAVGQLIGVAILIACALIYGLVRLVS